MKLMVCALLLFAVTAAADETLRRVQEELRKRNIYYGEIDGKKTSEFVAALQHYQGRKGFAQTGELDSETLRSLDLSAGNAPANAWPDVAVLKSDHALAQKTESSPPPVLEAEPAGSPFDPARVREFLDAYMHDSETNNLGAEMSYYSDPLDYFDDGVVNLDFVKRDIKSYYKRWPQRKYEVANLEPSVVPAHPEQIALKFRLKFKVQNAQHTVTGQTENVFTLKAEGSNYKIVAVRERRVRTE
ncbi:MAG: hypothetical protein QOD99_1880 [Chthoniobacter sp.]|jgi:peptidoglycan hydrolase-like protein with peptidoglycan-binding domain|nr:hypothetical protein [Chthoniobacter sp.]